MFPRFRAGDLSDGRETHIEVAGDLRYGLSSRAAFQNLQDLLIVKFRKKMLRPFAVPGAPFENMKGMPSVLGDRAVFEIFYAVVSRIAVFVIANFARFRGANESMQDQSVYQLSFLLSTSRPMQGHPEMA